MTSLAGQAGRPPRCRLEQHGLTKSHWYDKLEYQEVNHHADGPGRNHGRYPNRSQAIQTAVREKVERWNHTRLAEEAAKLNPKEERALAEERFTGDAWPEF